MEDPRCPYCKEKVQKGVEQEPALSVINNEYEKVLIKDSNGQIVKNYKGEPVYDYIGVKTTYRCPMCKRIYIGVSPLIHHIQMQVNDQIINPVIAKV